MQASLEGTTGIYFVLVQIPTSQASNKSTDWAAKETNDTKQGDNMIWIRSEF